MKESNTRKRKWLAAGGLGIVAALAALGILSGTLAKYTHTETLTSTARVAVFDVSVGDGKDDFDLFKTIYDSDGVNVETDVEKAGPGETAIIAPGTSGNFELVLNNDSEVNVGYTVELTVDGATIPLQFRIDTNAPWENAAKLDANGTIDMHDTEKVTVYWQWPFDGNDTLDNELGDAARQDRDSVIATATANVAFTQID